jgi:secreted trypsin-like serine protease
VGLFVKYNDPAKGITDVWLQWCTGSLLSSKLILTAAHCVKDVQPADILINFSGKTVTMDQQLNPATCLADPSAIFEIRHVKGLASHPSFDGSGNHDLAVLALDQDAPATAKAVSLLPSQFVKQELNQTTFEGQNLAVLLMGFGLINEEPSTDTDVIRSAIVKAQFLNNLVVTDQTQGTGGCHGDSGGPAFLNLNGVFYQVGVTHGPHANSSTCHETGEWVNPALDANFLADAAKKLNP